MSQIFYAGTIIGTIKITCPHCKWSARHSVSYIEDAIHDNLSIVCVACGESFEIMTMRQTRVVEHRDEAVGEGADETPKFLSTED